MKEMPLHPHLCARAGQSLVELLVAIGVGALVIAGTFAAISPGLRTQGDAVKAAQASALGMELLENARVLAEEDWHTLDALSTTSANRYYITTSPLRAATGTESVLLATSTFVRYFYLDDAFRDSSGAIAAVGTTRDPSTRKITVVYGFASATSSFQSYLTRSAGGVFTQTDWSSGGGAEGPVTATGTNAAFASSSGIDYTTTTGSIVISGF